MTTWYGQQIEAGFLKKKRPITGDPVYLDDIQLGVKYRKAGDDKGHLVSHASFGTDDPVTFCGIGLFEDLDWWHQSGAEECYGPFVVVEDGRKGSHCGPCTTAARKAGDYRQPVVDKAPAHDYADVRDEMLFATNVVDFRRRCESVRRQLGGVFV
jgi:hypothetical protein